MAARHVSSAYRSTHGSTHLSVYSYQFGEDSAGHLRTSETFLALAWRFLLENVAENKPDLHES